MDTLKIIKYLYKQNEAVSVDRIADDLGLTKSDVEISLHKFQEIFEGELVLTHYYQLKNSQWITLLEDLGMMNGSNKRKRES